MSFRDNIAPQRVNPIMEHIESAAAPASVSTQERTQGQTAKYRTVSASPKAGVDVGNQVKVQGNTKNTGVVGRPSSIGNQSRDFTAPAKANPSETRNQTKSVYEA